MSCHAARGQGEWAGWRNDSRNKSCQRKTTWGHFYATKVSLYYSLVSALPLGDWEVFNSDAITIWQRHVEICQFNKYVTYLASLSPSLLSASSYLTHIILWEKRGCALTLTLSYRRRLTFMCGHRDVCQNTYSRYMVSLPTKRSPVAAMSAADAERSMNTSPAPPPFSFCPSHVVLPLHSMHSLPVFVYPSPSHLGPSGSLGRKHDGCLRAQPWCWPPPTP